MGIGEVFKEFIGNLAVDNAQSISDRYGEITSALNKAFRDTESKTANTLQVGSYGRWTAIHGISDLDMLYIMPKGQWATYDKEGGQAKLLSDAAAAIKGRYPKTDIGVDRLIVRVRYSNFHVEAQPVFQMEDGSFKYPDTYRGGHWKITKPLEEMAAMSEFDQQKNKNLRRLCKMARAWKNKHGVGMGGLLIDTLAHKFIQSTAQYDDKSYLYYDLMSRDFFQYLSNLPKQEYFMALGSGQRVKVKANFRKKAAKAYDLCLKAIAAEGTDKQNDKWKAVFGRPFPSQVKVAKAALSEARFRHTEEFVENSLRVDVRYNITIDCDITQDGFRPASLRDMLTRGVFLQPRKRLHFSVTTTDVPGQFGLFWKVLNRGPEAEKRDMIRGQIVADKGHREIVEYTTFKGDHVVECYAVQYGVVVATDRIHVPISSNSDDDDG
ncbi:nucleotide-binding domain-containing protein [Sphingomonas psychrotolerans]|uniref:Nucleotidyltransferase n=1 Tax=Sphingomonas psychrotolerans TaxID=1327635 RepID=A0A2K8MA93_9SPHN|nr:nucleotidyltransferase [Sphingomonas psychrotolerans]ATY30793.1 nucleotidyltransferase [Sphingomonas psychrotolerans]